MIHASNITLAYGKRILFKDVDIKFTPGNCYGLIGANGTGKSTFLKIMSGEIEADKGHILTGPVHVEGAERGDIGPRLRLVDDLHDAAAQMMS